MNREEIEKLLTEAGVADAKPVLEKIMALNGADVSKVRAELDSVKSKYEKYDEYKAAAESKQADIDKAVEEAKKAATTELQAQFENEKTADKRKRAREKAYADLSDEQKGILDAFVKDDVLKLSDDGDSFANWDEVVKPVKEKYKSLFPTDPDNKFERGGLPPVPGTPLAATVDPFGLNLIPVTPKK